MLWFELAESRSLDTWANERGALLHIIYLVAYNLESYSNVKDA